MDSVRDGYFLPKPLRALARWPRLRLLALALALTVALGAEETQHRVLEALDRFACGSYHDDVTTVVLAVKPPGRA